MACSARPPSIQTAVFRDTSLELWSNFVLCFLLFCLFVLFVFVLELEECATQYGVGLFEAMSSDGLGCDAVTSSDAR